MSNKKLIRVAFIDDHDKLRNGICALFEQFGFETVFDAENGQVALEKMQQSKPIPDICIIDLNMPVMDGFDTTSALCEKYPRMKILAFSVNDDRDDVIRMIECGANGYILKGGDPEELKHAVEVIVNGGQYFSAGVCDIASEYFSHRSQV